MKFSASFVIIGLAFCKTTFALPVDSDVLDLFERDLSDVYDLEARGFYDSVYEERSFDDEFDLFERDIPRENVYPRNNKHHGNSKPGAKPGASLKPNSAQCKAKFHKSGKKRSMMSARTNTGQSITVGGKTYKLGENMSGSGGDVTFEVDGGKEFAKRPKRPGNPPADFTTEVSNTKKASEALHSGLFIAEGVSDNYHWLITKKMDGVRIMDRWFNHPENFDTKKKCEDDMTAARKVIKAQQEKLAHAGVGVHADSHPGNWLVNLEGAIHTALPIDFGRVWPANSDIDRLLTDQYKYPANDWAVLASECGICK